MTLKLKFDSNLQFQIDAINSVVNLFEGQPIETKDFDFGKKETELVEFSGVGNRLVLNEDAILQNFQKVQDTNDLEISKKLEGMNFSVEMETGTGKTYVYLRTIFELNQKYGFKKFVIVVPSVAIREGVLKSILIMKQHFEELYNRTPFKHYVYDSKNITNISAFARNNNIQILIINIDAFKKTIDNVDDESKANIIHRIRDQLHGRKPIEFIQAVNPIVIIDEPQSVDNTEKAQQAIQTLNPLCTLRYSATHRNVYNLVYSLNAIKAYDQRLVKKIQVTSVVEEIAGNNAYVKLTKTDNKNGIKAKVSIHYLNKGVITEKSVQIKQGSDLYESSNNHEIYSNGYKVSIIDCTPEQEYIEFVNGVRVRLNQEIGGNSDDIQKVQIKTAIQQHLDNELSLLKQGIKVLSLFFIDRVANYRYYDDEQTKKGKFALWFEESFTELISKPQYKELAESTYKNHDISKVHDGYFAQDKAGHWKDTRGDTQDDDSVYDKIMKNKEQLLSLDEPLRFIFSHSALREGWDNPNVFQICTLNDTKSIIKKRQEIGRGLRLAVNQNGDRVKEDRINRLTVIANESYEQFCRTLQSEYEEDGIEFGKISTVLFKKLEVIKYEGNEQIGSKKSEEIFNHLVEQGYLTAEGQITAKFTPEETNFVLDIKEEYQQFRPKIVDLIKSHLITTRIENTKDKATKKLNKEVYLSPDFKELWNRISHKTTYSVEYITEELVINIARRFKTLPKIEPAKISIKKASVGIEKKGVEGTLLREQVAELDALNYIPDILSLLDKELDYKLTRHALAQIILKSDRLNELSLNPHEFVRQLIQVIKTELSKLILFGIKYEKIEGEYYEMRQLDPDINTEIKEYIKSKAITCEHSVYDVVEYDSETEKEFARALDKQENIKLFAKLPSWFKVDTPVGKYNPDWAVLKENDEKLYLICETKGSLDYGQLRTTEDIKIECGKKHFESLKTGVQFRKVTNITQL